MISPFDCQGVDESEVYETAVKLLNLVGEEGTIDYLSEIASNVWSCPDKCDIWAINYYNENLDKG